MGPVRPRVATGCPPIDTYAFDFGPFTLEGSPASPDSAVSYAPRRTVLDKLLVDAASEAGAEVREGFTVEEVLVDGGRVTGIRGHGRGGSSVTEHARVVIGADGLSSTLARAVHPEQYNEKPPLLAAYYTYWSGLPMHGRFEVYVRSYCSFAAWPTNDGRTLVIAGWQYKEFEANKSDIEGNYHKVIDLAPSFAERLRGARREERFAGCRCRTTSASPLVRAGRWWATRATTRTSSRLRASRTRSATPIRAPRRWTQSFTGARSFDAAMADYQSARDRHVMAMYEFTAELASQEPPPPELQKLLGAMHGNQLAMDGFARVSAGVTSPAEFFSEENVQRIFAAAR